jgi:hypothetical protein
MMGFVTKAVTGTGSDIDVDLGFTPSYVKVINRTQVTMLEYCEGMGDDNAIEYASGGGLTSISTDGVTVISKSSVDSGDPVTFSGFHGVQIPAAFQSDSDELYVIAARN